ncbi:MAG: hypothetical protein OXC60_03910 [Litoreibacter sp.]|nr:hypothetical protein [Litoreibacter sp.]
MSAYASEQNAPLSAIGWLSDVVAEPDLETSDTSNDVARSVTVAPVTTTPLGQTRLDAVGILPRSVTGLPADFWSRSSAQDLVAELRNLRTDLPPPLAQLLTRLLLAELPAPADSTEGAELFLARVDKFLELGALDQAEALLSRAGPSQPSVFGRWFDVSLLTGQEERACDALRQSPEVAPTYAANVFCLARAGDWQGAGKAFEQGRSAGAISEKEGRLLERFLDPELFEGEPLLPIPDRVTPLNFRMHEAIGEALSPAGLPNAFSYAELSERTGWKARIAAAERLARANAIPHQQLFALYNERKPAASGGVWDRVSAIQAFEAALSTSDTKALSFQLPIAMRAMRSAGLEFAFAQSYGTRVASLPLTGDAKQAAFRAGLMSKDYENVAMTSKDAGPRIWTAVAKGLASEAESDDALEAAIASGFKATAPPAQFEPLLEGRRLGEAALKAIGIMADGARTDPGDVERGISVLVQLGLEDLARQTALYMLLTRPRE